MANTMDNEDFFYAPRDSEYPSAGEPMHWVDADGAPNPSEGTFSPFTYHYIQVPPMRQKRRHSLMPWLIAALILLLLLPFFKVVLTVLAVISFVVVLFFGLGVLALFVGTLILAQRMRTLSRRMYM